MSISHIFFELSHVLIDNNILRQSWNRELGLVMASLYGGDAIKWSQAEQAIVADWDSYYRDLDLGDDEGLHDMWEGLFRTTRALFRIIQIPEPEKNELISLSRRLSAIVAARCNALYPDVFSTLQQLHQAGYILGIISHMPTNKSNGLLRGGHVSDYFTGPITGPDTVGHFLKDRAFYNVAIKQAAVASTACLVVDRHLEDLQSARSTGMMTAYCDRAQTRSESKPDVDFTLNNGLSDLLPFLLKS